MLNKGKGTLVHNTAYGFKFPTQYWNCPPSTPQFLLLSGFHIGFLSVAREQVKVISGSQIWLAVPLHTQTCLGPLSHPQREHVLLSWEVVLYLQFAAATDCWVRRRSSSVRKHSSPGYGGSSGHSECLVISIVEWRILPNTWSDRCPVSAPTSASDNVISTKSEDQYIGFA